MCDEVVVEVTASVLTSPSGAAPKWDFASTMLTTGKICDEAYRLEISKFVRYEIKLFRGTW